MSHSTRMTALWLVLYILLTGCAPKVEPAIAGTWAVCHNGRDGEIVYGGPVLEEIVHFYEDGTFHIFPKYMYSIDGADAQTTGEYQLLTVKRTATSAHGNMQFTLTKPTSVTVRVPYTYRPQSTEIRGLLLLATDSNYFPCQPCVLCQATVVVGTD